MKFKRSCLVTLLSLMMTGCAQDVMKDFENTEMTYLDKDKTLEEYRDNSTSSSGGSSSFMPFWLGWMAARSLGGSLGNNQTAFRGATAPQVNPAEKHMSNIQRTKANITARGSSSMRGSFGA